VRIIAGQYKGRRLEAPAWDGLRPTSDKLRETLFNILAPRIAGARLLDGYAGTGALGIEALSRGAAHVTFVERDRRATALIARNLDACGVTQGYTIESGDLVSVLPRGCAGGPFDLILLDPPYDIANLSAALDASARCLVQDGLIVLERATRRQPDLPDTLARMRDVASGDSTLTLLARSAGSPAENR
jgi:16S rRNA (guanine966-N2)-methyltransferase